MLVLSRRPQQSLLIGHDVIITVLEVNGDTVRIGISAPAEVQVHREEVYRDLQASNREAAAKPGAAADLSRRVRSQRKGGTTPAARPLPGPPRTATTPSMPSTPGTIPTPTAPPSDGPSV